MSERNEGMRCLPEALEEQRLLTEVMHLVGYMQPDGSVPQEVMRDVHMNLFTSVQELAMPSAVTTTIHRVEYAHDEEGRQKRIIRWLGKSAIDVAESGYDHYYSEPALERVGVEVAEAAFAQENLQTGMADIFISPKMSSYDAPEEIAKNENLFEQDGIRVSYAVTDARGTVVARRLESLLVTDIPLESWVAMLKDPANMFGMSYDVKNELSALSVMELFRELRLPEAMVPEGPVTIIEAVLPYIQDARQRSSVLRQLGKFRNGQELYRAQAEQKADEWLNFEIELARSLAQGRGTFTIEAFIGSLQHQWGAEDLQVILAHARGGRYAMTSKLAAVLERAKQNLIGGEAALATGNEKVISQMDPVVANRIIEEIRFIETIRSVASPEEIQARQAMLHRNIAKQNLRVGGGCAGDRVGRFSGGDNSDDSSYEAESTSGSEAGSDKSEDGESWTWKKGVCRVENCASPKPTEVGPCNVCRNCQHMFDRGIDPTKANRVVEKMVEKAFTQPDWVSQFFAPKKDAHKASAKTANRQKKERRLDPVGSHEEKDAFQLAA